MNEYISKQSVLDYLNGYLHSLGEGGAGGADDLLFNRGQCRALINAIQDISAVKAADVQPVKHGRWKDGEKSQVCTICGGWGLDSFAHCPHCGAKMIKDGDAE